MAAVEVFTWPIRVYYEDTDAGAVVYHSQYLNFMERARTEWVRQLGFEQTWLKTELGIVFVVHGLQIDYKKPAFFNDALQVRTKVTQLNFASMTFEQSIYREQTLLVQANIKIACVNATNFSPAAIPDAVKQEMQSFLKV